MIAKNEPKDGFAKNCLVVEFLGPNIIDVNILMSETSETYHTYVRRIKGFQKESVVDFNISGWMNQDEWLEEYGYRQYRIAGVDNV